MWPHSICCCAGSRRRRKHWAVKRLSPETANVCEIPAGDEANVAGVTGRTSGKNGAELACGIRLGRSLVSNIERCRHELPQTPQRQQSQGSQIWKQKGSEGRRAIDIIVEGMHRGAFEVGGDMQHKPPEADRSFKH